MGRLLDKFLQHPVLLLALACSSLFYLPLGMRAFWDPLEGHIAETARLMVETGAWLAPHSPLFQGFVTLCLKLFGYSEWAARLPSATFGVLCVWITYRFGRHWKGEQTGL